MAHRGCYKWALRKIPAVSASAAEATPCLSVYIQPVWHHSYSFDDGMFFAKKNSAILLLALGMTKHATFELVFTIMSLS